jgi:hypothetical protein
MKSNHFFSLIFCYFIFLSCSTDNDRSDVNFIRANINGIDLKFNIISVDTEDYTEYIDIIVSATMESDPSKKIIIASQFGITGENEIWRCDYFTNNTFYRIQNPEAFLSNITKNSDNQYNATFSGNLINPETDEIFVLTNGEMKIKY